MNQNKMSVNIPIPDNKTNLITYTHVMFLYVLMILILKNWVKNLLLRKIYTPLIVIAQ